MMFRAGENVVDDHVVRTLEPPPRQKNKGPQGVEAVVVDSIDHAEVVGRSVQLRNSGGDHGHMRRRPDGDRILDGDRRPLMPVMMLAWLGRIIRSAPMPLVRAF